MNSPNQLYQLVAPDVKLGRRVKLYAFTKRYGCEIGDFVEIRKRARVGARSKVSSHTFICEGVTLQDEVFIGHGVTFIKDLFPRATNVDGSLQTAADWKCEPTLMKLGASIGSGVTIGERATVGAGSVVTKDVPTDAVVAGNPPAGALDPSRPIPLGPGYFALDAHERAVRIHSAHA